ncbi:MAG: hypothetical protein FD175_2167 [Beijerinckiaceae bacterium]|nr:MAG: hypothetical protein FD175_2167 [Beijerinckiaceae bacterium]
MAGHQLPQPTELGAKLGQNVRHLLKLFGAYAPRVGPLIQTWLEKQLESAEANLVKAIEDGDIDQIDNTNFDYLVPNVYSYMEAARSGEHIHNLRILAEILVSGYSKIEQAPFAVRNAAKRLSGMSVRDLELLTICHRSFLRSKNDPIREKLRSDWPDWTCVDYFRDELGNGSESTVRNALSEFLVRGFLSVDLQPNTFGGNGYYKTPYFEEVILAAQNISKS